MATSTIKNPRAKTWGKPVVDTNWTLTENNNLGMRKWGNIVELYGWIVNTVAVPTYSNVFNIPQGFRPSDGISLRANTVDNSTTWIFIDTNTGNASTQAESLKVGTHYFTALWFTNE